MLMFYIFRCSQYLYKLLITQKTALINVFPQDFNMMFCLMFIIEKNIFFSDTFHRFRCLYNMDATTTMGDDTYNKTENADIEGLFRKFGPMVFRRCSRILGDSHEAADAVQEVFVKVLEYKKTPNCGFSAGFLWSTATNHCLNVLRDKARHGGNIDGEPLLEKIACADDTEALVGNRNILSKLFSRHPKSSRTIAYLHLIDGMTLEETAQVVNMSVSGVRKRLAALRETLGKMEGV